jgi:hypothetical protein
LRNLVRNRNLEGNSRPSNSRRCLPPCASRRPRSRSTISAAFARRGAERWGRSGPFRCTRSACPRTFYPARLSSARPTSA